VRLFLALEPSAPFRRAVAERVAQRRDSLPPASWVREPNLHLTLLFFGEVEDAALARTIAALESTRTPAPATAVSVGSAGAFPERGPVRVIWLGLEPARDLALVAEAFRAAAGRAGLSFDAKPFRPHLTLARCRRPWPGSLRQGLAEMVPTPSPTFRATYAALLSSVLTPGGASYSALAKIPLAEAA
jgi:2'-5' RNA ligase